MYSTLTGNICLGLKLTCVQSPPVDLVEEGVRPEVVTRSVPEAEPLLDLFSQQTRTDGASVLTELLRINYWFVQDPLLHHLVLHLRAEQRPAEMNLYVSTTKKTVHVTLI